MNSFGFLPLAAYAYEAPENELVMELLGVPIRRIFFCHESKYSQIERDKLDEMERYMKEHNFEIPSNYGRQDMLRQLQGNDYDIEISFEQIKHEIEWKAQTLPIQLSDEISEILNSGFVYTHGRDNRYRPLIIFNPAKFDKVKYSFPSYQNACYFFIEFMINNYFLPGKVENWIIIVDCGELKMSNIPFQLKDLFAGMKGVYRCRLFKLYLMNLNKIFTFCWNLAKNIIGPTIEAKAQMITPDEGKYNDLFKNINRKQVEQKYGGEAPNLTIGQYFPDRFFVDEFSSAEEESTGKKLKGCEIDYFQDDNEIYFETCSEEENT